MALRTVTRAYKIGRPLLFRPAINDIRQLSQEVAAKVALKTAPEDEDDLLGDTRSAEAGLVLSGAKYGGRQHVSLIPGDGIGTELMKLVKTVVKVAGSPIDFEEIEFPSDGDSTQHMESAILSIKRNGVALKGNLETFEGKTSKNVELRRRLGLFAYVQRCKSIDGVRTRHSGVDILVIRENTEGEYSQLEHYNVPGVVESLKIITAEKSRQIAEYAFETAIKNRRKKVTAVHKANIMKLSDGLFLKVCREVASNYPQIEFNDMIVDNCCMQLVSKPQQFDVMVMPNLYGNVVGNVAAGLVGGPGVAAGKNIGSKYAIFECGTRGSSKTNLDSNVANPSAMLLSTADMLEYIGANTDASNLRLAVLSALKDGVHTPDLGGNASTADVFDAVLERLSSVRGLG